MKIKLGDFGKILNGKSIKLTNGKYPVYGGNGIIGYSDKYNYDKNTIIIGRVGAQCGSVYHSDTKCWVTDNALAFVLDNPNHSYYLFCLLQMLDLNKFHIGSSQPLITQSIISNIECDIPNKYVDKIAELFKNIDNKLRINKKINLELESLTKTIYDYWFLQFEFPNEEGKPYKSSGGKMVWNEELKREIPADWQLIKFSDFMTFKKGKIPLDIFDDKKENSVEYITIDVAKNGIPQYVNPENLIQCNGETIMVMDGAASGDVYVGNYGVLGSTFSMIQSKRKDISNALIYNILNSNKPIYTKANTGSTVPHANKSFINNLKIPVANDMSFASFKFDIIQELIEENNKQIRELESLRDFLLPLLMNGQVTFKDGIL